MDYRDLKAKVIAFGSITLLIGSIAVLLPLLLNGSLPLYFGVIICGAVCLFGFLCRTPKQSDKKSSKTSPLNIQYNKETIKSVHDVDVIQDELDRVTKDLGSCLMMHGYSDQDIEELESYRRYLVPKFAYLIFGLEHVNWITKTDPRDWPEWVEYLRCEHGITDPVIRKTRQYDKGS